MTIRAGEGKLLWQEPTYLMQVLSSCFSPSFSPKSFYRFHFIVCVWGGVYVCVCVCLWWGDLCVLRTHRVKTRALEVVIRLTMCTLITKHRSAALNCWLAKHTSKMQWLRNEWWSGKIFKETENCLLYGFYITSGFSHQVYSLTSTPTWLGRFTEIPMPLAMF